MFPVKCETVGIKLETTQNTAATLAATDYFQGEDVSFKPAQEYLPREYKRASLDKLASVPGAYWADISFKMEIKGSGSPGVAIAPYSAAFQASAFSETIVASTSVTYAPTSVPASTNFFTIGKSATIEYYEGSTTTRSGLKHIIKGCVATGGPKLVMEAGKFGVYEFSFRGLVVATTDSVAPATTYSSVLPPKIQNASFTLHGFAAVISKLELDYGNVISARKDVNSADGLKGFGITDRDPKGSCDPELELVATFDFYGKARSAAEGALSIVIGASAGNITTIAAPKAQFAGGDPGDRDGTRTFSTPLKLNQNTGDDCMTIVLT